jgi:hypothetical protein
MTTLTDTFREISTTRNHTGNATQRRNPVTEKVVDFPDQSLSNSNIDDAAALLEDARRKGGEALVNALEAVVIDNLLRRHREGPVFGVLKLIHCAEALFGPLGLSVGPTGEVPAGFPIMIELPEGTDRLWIAGQMFVKAA